MALRIEVTHGGGKRIDAHIGQTTVHTDQPVQAGGGGEAPAPFALFLSSLATCAGYFVVTFCQARDIPTEGIRIYQDHTFDPASRALTGIDLTIELPPDFPDKYRKAVTKAASACTVKRLLENPPRMSVEARVAAPTERAAQ